MDLPQEPRSSNRQGDAAVAEHGLAVFDDRPGVLDAPEARGVRQAKTDLLAWCRWVKQKPAEKPRTAPTDDGGGEDGGTPFGRHTRALEGRTDDRLPGGSKQSVLRDQAQGPRLPDNQESPGLALFCRGQTSNPLPLIPLKMSRKLNSAFLSGYFMPRQLTGELAFLTQSTFQTRSNYPITVFGRMKERM